MTIRSTDHCLPGYALEIVPGNHGHYHLRATVNGHQIQGLVGFFDLPAALDYAARNHKAVNWTVVTPETPKL